MSTPDSRLRHGAFVYDGQDEYVDLSVSFLREGLAAGEAAVVAHHRAGLAVLRDALGDDAAQVTFVDVGAAYTRPARTLAAYHAVYADELRRAPAVRAVADVQFGPDPAEWDTWTGYEAAFNRSFAHLPAWVLCSYDGTRLPEPVREGVLRTHPELVVGTSWGPSAGYEDPDLLLRRMEPERETPAGLRPMTTGRDAEEFREHLAREMDVDGVPPPRALDMLLAATEVYDNAQRHGGGVTAVRVGRVDGRFVCEVVDRGPGVHDPAAGYLAPRPGVGAGLWVARQLTWQIDLVPTAAGCTARIWL